MDYPSQNSINNNLALHKPEFSNEDLEVFNKVLTRDISQNSKKAITGDFKHFFTFYASINKETFTFRRLTERDFIDYKRFCSEHLKHSPATFNRRLVHLHLLCQKALEMGLFKNDPTENIKSFPVQSLAPKGLPPQELRALLKEVEIRGNVRDRLIIEMLVGAGFRVSEIANLRVEDIFLRERKGHIIVRYGKGNKTRSVPLNSKIRALYGAKKLDESVIKFTKESKS